MMRCSGIALLAVVTACTGSSPRVKNEIPPPGAAPAGKDADERKCLETLEVDHVGSVVEEQLAAGKPVPDFRERIAAAAVDPKSFTPVKATASLRIDGQPLLWLTPDRSAVVVDNRWFSDLQIADATRLADGETARVGAVTAAARPKLAGRELVHFLIRSGAVRTYQHIGASLCLVSEKPEGNAYEARFFGVHVFYTNNRNDVRYEFSVRIDDKGEITATGL